MFCWRSLVWITTIAVLIVCLSGCATTGDQMKSWLGHNVTELVNVWGAPDATFEYPTGETLYTWRSTATTNWPNDFTDYTKGSTTYFRKQERSFWVDRHGTIIRVSWQG